MEAAKEGSILLRPVETLGRFVNNTLERTGHVLMLFASILKWVLRPPLDLVNVLRQMQVVGVSSLPVVLVTALFTGMVLALQSYTGFKRFGAEGLVGTVVALSMTRELGPVLTALIVTGRAGAGMAAELGTMRVTEQIDALETLATNPVKYLVVPRFISGLAMLPFLTVVSDIVGIIGGYFVTVGLLGTNSTTYMRMTWDYIAFNDILSGLIKACFFGAALSLICCYNGFYTRGGAEGVGKATTRAVVISFMTILISDYFLSAWLFE